MSALSELKASYKKRWATWITRRLPRIDTITLNQRRVFIFLTKPGFLVVLLILALFITGINYANNLLLGLCFFLASLFVITIHHTFSNLNGLRITKVMVKSTTVGQPAIFILELDNPKNNTHTAIDLEWQGIKRTAAYIDKSIQIEMPLVTHDRGWMRPDRLRVGTIYPLGWLQCWTWLDMNMVALVYPRPITSDFPPFGEGKDDQGKLISKMGTDDFDGLKDFTPGDSLAHISWKLLARGQGLKTKRFTGEEQGSSLLDWHALAGLDVEQRLSCLTWWVMAFSEQDRAFGLKMPGIDIGIGKGQEHRDKCLILLALWGRPEVPS